MDGIYQHHRSTWPGLCTHAQTKTRLAGMLDRWMVETADPLLDGDIPDRLHGWPEQR